LIQRKDGRGDIGHSRDVRSTDILHELVSDVLAHAPAAVAVFLRRGMSCPGCPFARFETVAEAAAIYQQDADELAAAIRQSLSAAPGGCEQ
jgi:hybrid cluster-associated redox disulfide protein